MEWDEVSKLLDVIHDTRELPKLKSIHDLAMITLEGMAEEANEKLDEMLAEKRKAEAAKAAEATKAAEQPPAQRAERSFAKPENGGMGRRI